MAKYTDLGSLPADDPIYSSGPIVGGKRWNNSKKGKTAKNKPDSSVADLSITGAINTVSMKADATLSGKTNADHEPKQKPNCDEDNIGGKT